MAFTGKATFSAGATLPELAEDVADVIGIVSPHETPLLDHLGDPKRAATSTVHEWIEDSLLPNRGTINQESFSPGATTATSITTDDASVFREGDLIRPHGTEEVALVVQVNTSNDIITIARGYGGTVAGTLADDMVLHIIGNAAMEGADAPAARFTGRQRKSNYTQILTAAIEVSGSMQAARAHGIQDEVDYQKQERMRELLRDLENCVINGVAAAIDPQGSASIRRSMDGIIHTVATNVFAPGTGDMPDGGGDNDDELTEELLNAALKAIWDQSSAGIDTIWSMAHRSGASTRSPTDRAASCLKTRCIRTSSACTRATSACARLC